MEGIGPSLQSLVHTAQILLCPVIPEFSPKINPRAKMETIPLTINELENCLWGREHQPALAWLPQPSEHPEGRGSRGSPSQAGMQDLLSRENPPLPLPGKDLKPEGGKFLFCVI